MIADALEPSDDTPRRSDRGLLLSSVRLACAIAVVVAIASCGGGVPSATPDVIADGDCVTVSGRENDLSLTELPCDDPQAQYRVDVRTGIADVPCPSKSDVKVPSDAVYGWYCLSALPGR